MHVCDTPERPLPARLELRREPRSSEGNSGEDPPLTQARTKCWCEYKLKLAEDLRRANGQMRDRGHAADAEAGARLWIVSIR